MHAAWYESWYDSWRTIRGVARSLRIYYGNGERRAAIDRLYGSFVAAGDLPFHNGAPVGGPHPLPPPPGPPRVAGAPQPAPVHTARHLLRPQRPEAAQTGATR